MRSCDINLSASAETSPILTDRSYRPRGQQRLDAIENRQPPRSLIGRCLLRSSIDTSVTALVVVSKPAPASCVVSDDQIHGLAFELAAGVREHRTFPRQPISGGRRCLPRGQLKVAEYVPRRPG
jgi:hypothetical protein